MLNVRVDANRHERTIVREGAVAMLNHYRDGLHHLSNEVVKNLSYKPQGLSSPESGIKAMRELLEAMETALRMYREALLW